MEHCSSKSNPCTSDDDDDSDGLSESNLQIMNASNPMVTSSTTLLDQLYKRNVVDTSAGACSTIEGETQGQSENFWIGRFM